MTNLNYDFPGAIGSGTGYLGNPISSTTNPNADLPAEDFPSLRRIIVTDLVGPVASNAQEKALEKRDEYLRSILVKVQSTINQLDVWFLRRDSSVQKDGQSGLQGDLETNSHRLTNMPASTTTGNAVEHSQLVAEQAARAAADTSLQSQINLKAPLASPTFTGTPSAPTPTLGDNSTRLATTAFVQSAVSAAPGGVLLTSGSGTWTVPANVRRIHVTMAGGGGGGGSNSDGGSGPSGSNPGSGGGAGAVSDFFLNVTPGDVFNYSIGSGGAAGINGNNGAAGGTTTFSNGSWSATCAGGAAGQGGNSGANRPGGLGGQVRLSIPSGFKRYDGGAGGPTTTGNGGDGGGGAGMYTDGSTGSAPGTIGPIGGVGGPVTGGPEFGGAGSTFPQRGGNGQYGGGGGGNGAADINSIAGVGGDGFIYIRWG